MTIPQACELNVQAAAKGKGGQVRIGQRIEIVDVTWRLTDKPRSSVNEVFSGLRQQRDSIGAHQ